MALTAQQLTYLRTADQRFAAHVGVFPAYTPTVTAPTPGSGTLLTPRPVIRCSPRYSVVAHSTAITLNGQNTYVRGGAGVTPSFALHAGSSGTLVDNGDGTATYTAPGAGSGIATIDITATNSNGSKTGYAFVQYPKTTYDDTIAEIASISASIESHGYKMLLRARGDVSAFSIGKFVIAHVEDTWDTTTSTFGGYQYHEGVMAGYITATEQFEDFSGESWLGCEIQSPWWILERLPVGETYWGMTAASGRFYIADFRPIDAIWHFVNEITDFTLYHDVVMWFDENSIDDFIIDESDLGAIVDDVVNRTFSISYCDRYGSLFCIPDPDIRSDEYWGTPAPQYTGSGALSPDLVTNYSIRTNPYRCKKLTLSAFDKSKKGIFAISENPTSMGNKETIRGLLCDQALNLASWAVQKRAQLNRQWQIDVSIPLNHTMDLCNFADVNFTAPYQTNGKTASGRTWLSNLNYRPNVFDGGWVGRWTLLNQTEGQGEAETGAISAWGDSGTNIEIPNYTGDWGPSGWTASASGNDTWCILFDFVNSGAYKFTAIDQTWGGVFETAQSGTHGVYLAGQGWYTTSVVDSAAPHTSNTVQVVRYFNPSVITGVRVWGSATGTAQWSEVLELGVIYSSLWGRTANIQNGVTSVSWSGTATGSGITFRLYLNTVDLYVTSMSGVIKSAQLAGLGTNPFSEGDSC